MLDIQYKNFKPVNEQKENLEHLIKAMQPINDLLPEDSKAQVVFSKNNKKCIADIYVKHRRGGIAACFTADTFEAALENCLGRFYKQLHLWHITRFINTFGMEMQSEENFFQEYKTLATQNEVQDEKVLIVDDDPTSGSVLEVVFQKLGYKTTLVTDGNVAVDSIVSENYDVIVLDWCLPYKNGDEIIQEAQIQLSQRRHKVKYTPIITCSAMPRDNIHFPRLDYFYHIDHWQKGEGFSSLVKQAHRVMEGVSNMSIL